MIFFHSNILIQGLLLHTKKIGSKAYFSGFDSYFGEGSKQVRFGFDSDSILNVRIRFGFDFFGFDTALQFSKVKMIDNTVELFTHASRVTTNKFSKFESNSK